MAGRRVLERFRTVGADRTRRIERDLVQFEQDGGDPELKERVYMEIHTLKGEAGMVGLGEISEVTHAVERGLHALLGGVAERPDAVIELVLEGLDAVRKALKTAPADPPEVDDFTERMSVEVPLVEAVDGPPPTVEEPAAARSQPDVPTPVGAREAPKAPPAPRPAEVAESRVPEARLEPESVPARPVHTGDETLLVDLTRLDRLTELSGDLRFRYSRQGGDLEELDRSARRLSRLARQGTEGLALITDVSNVPRRELEQSLLEAKALLGDLSAQADQVAERSARAGRQAFDDGLQIRSLDLLVRDLRFLPLSAVFENLPRAVRDLARTQDKAIRLRLSGGDVELDKRVLDALSEPLAHLVRNSVDHGLEAADERKAAGKDPTGELRIDARRMGNSVQLTVTDDGRGIDFDRVREVAVTRGLVNATEASELSTERLAEMLFVRGLTTRDSVTQLSGRGVGLAAVSRMVHDLGGQVRLTSSLGRGTTFTLEIPVSAVLSQVTIVSAGGVWYALHCDEVRSVGVVPDDAFETTGRGSVVRMPEGEFPTADLAAVCGRTAQPPLDGQRRVMVVAAGDEVLALTVDRFGGDHQVVLRPLQPLVEKLPLIAGTVTLPGGDLAVLLDVRQILREANFRSRWRVPEASEQSSTARVLVIDDSEFTRDMVVGLLKDLGLDVAEAVNGRQGLGMVERVKPNLVLTDLEMPVMGGFEFLREFRRLANHSTTPVIVFSTRGSDEDKDRARALGADGYLVKSEFTEEALSRAVHRFLDAVTS